MENVISTPKVRYYEIACQQVLEKDNSVFSIQWVVIPEIHARDLTPDKLLGLFFGYIRRFTLTLVRPIDTGEGIEYRLLNSSIALIKFSPPEHSLTPRGASATLHIAGGLLVQPRQCDRGELAFLVEQTDDGIKLTLQLSDFCPLILGSHKPSIWRKWLYRLTQAFIHKMITVRFLSMVFHRIEGETPRSKVVKVVLRQGMET